MFEYRAKLSRVIDGDTVDLTVDMGFHCSITERFRLLDYNAPEMYALGGAVAKRQLEYLLTGKPLILYSTKQDGFRRWLAALYVEGEDISINQKMTKFLTGGA